MIFLQNRLGGSYIIKTLLYQIFKAKFFQNCSVIKVKDSNSGSYTWKSILKGNDVLKKGALLRVGNGSSFKLSDNWLPTPNHSKSLSLGATQFLELSASYLINQSTNLWNSYLVDSLFPPQEASTIKGIPLSRFPTADILYWSLENNGNFLVKSAYWFLSLDVTQLDPPQLIISSPPQNVRKKILGMFRSRQG